MHSNIPDPTRRPSVTRTQPVPRSRARSIAGPSAAVITALALAGTVAGGAAAARGSDPTAEIVGDTLLVTGSPAADQLSLVDGSGGTAVDVDLDGDSTPDDSFDRDDFTRVVVNAAGGGDTVRLQGAFSIEEETIVRGQRGGDTLLGADGPERFVAGRGDDFVAGGRGDDHGDLGRADDAFGWNPGDGSDTIEGRGGADTMLFNGAAVDETIDMSDDGGRLRFFRDVATVTMSTDDLETVRFNALGGVDRITVGDLSGTDVTAAQLELAGTLGGSTSDGAADRIVVEGTTGDDEVTVTGDSSAVEVSGLATTTTLSSPDPTDLLAVAGRAGADDIDASGLAAGAVTTALSGQRGGDTLLGSAGAETIRSGLGQDTIDGNQGDDTGLMGPGDDTFTWDPGDGNDVVEGGDGDGDVLDFNGSSGTEAFDLSANGPRLRFFRSLGPIVMDTDDTEIVDVDGNGGGDTLTVNDLTGTDVVDVLANFPQIMS